MFRVSYHDEESMLSIHAGQTYGRNDMPNKPDRMSSEHFQVISVTANDVYIRHIGKKDGIVEYGTSGLTMRAIKDETPEFQLFSGDAYKPMCDSSLRLTFVHAEPAVADEIMSDHTLVPEPVEWEITIDDVVRRSVRGHVYSAFEEERQKEGTRSTRKKGKKFLPHEMYLTRFLHDGLVHRVNRNRRGVKELLQIREQHEALDQRIRREGLDFHQTEDGYIGFPERILAERQALLERVLDEPAAECDGAEDIEQSEGEEDDLRYDDAAFLASNDEEEELDGFIVADEDQT